MKIENVGKEGDTKESFACIYDSREFSVEIIQKHMFIIIIIICIYFKNYFFYVLRIALCNKLNCRHCIDKMKIPMNERVITTV